MHDLRRILCALPAVAGPVWAASPAPQEMADARAWVASRCEGTGALEPVFSFALGGQKSADVLKTWTFDRHSEPIDGNRTRHTLTWRDPRTSLAVRMVAVAYGDYPTVEWTVYVRNDGHADSPIIENLQALDLRLDGGSQREFVLHHQRGSPCTAADYEPFQTVLGPNAAKRITAAGGRPTNSDLPCFNLMWADRGLIVVVGWPGQWAAEFVRDDASGLHITAGQELTHLVLHPGEEIRTPLIVLQFGRGDRFGAQNLWRRWMVEHNIPRPNGKLVPTHYASCWGNMQPSAAEEITIIDGFVREGFKLDYWILDAGWYPGQGKWTNTGTWEPDPQRFPHGLRQVADRVHQAGMQFVVWFEPERVAPSSWLYENHRDWLLGTDGNNKLLNLGNPQARQWLVDYMDRFFGEQGIDVYRQDFNIDPLPFWRAADAPDRQGITENNYVIGYLAWWDELLRRRPGLWIDSCASGGRRNDLETLRRAVPLLRSDYYQTAEAQQAQTWGLSLWMPYYGSGLGINDTYWFRSCIFPASRVGCDTRNKDLDYAHVKRMIAEFRRVEPYLLGDYWPLTPWSLDPKAWIAWQFDRPEMGEGCVQAFRRPECADATMRLPLRGLDPDAQYEVTNFDAGLPGESGGSQPGDPPARGRAGSPEYKPIVMNGKELTEQGLPVTLQSRPAAAIFVYRKVERR